LPCRKLVDKKDAENEGGHGLSDEGTGGKPPEKGKKPPFSKNNLHSPRRKGIRRKGR